MRRLLLASAFLLLSSAVQAQTISAWTLKISNQGAPSPLSTTILPAAQVTCNQASPAGVNINPTRVIFDDPANVGKVCIWTDPGTGPLFSVPFGGTYQGTVAATNAAGTSPDSVAALFTRPGAVPGVPTGVAFR